MVIIAFQSLFTRINSMDKGAKIILLLIIVIYLFTIAGLILRERTRRILWKSTLGYEGRDKLSSYLFTSVYRIFKTIPFTRSYIEKLSYQIRLICPCDSKVIAKTTVEACLISIFLSLIALVLIFLINPQLINLITALFGIVILNKEIVGRIANHYEINLDQEIQFLIENEIHNYYDKHRVDDALYHSMDYLGPNMKAVAEQIYRLLLSDDKEAALTEYYDNIPNKYLREFVSLCVGVADRGDQLIEGKYLFVKNLENLYEQLEIEIDKLQRLRMEFAGVMVIVILPIFSINIVKWFCISIKIDMEAFYYGKAGFLIDLALLTITSVIYTVMHKSSEYRSYRPSGYRWLYVLDRIPLIRRAMNNYCEKNASKLEGLKRRLKNNGYIIGARHYILRSFLVAGGVFIICLSISIYLNWTGREKLLIVEDSLIPTLTTAARENQYVNMKEIIETYIKRIILQKDIRTSITKEELLNQLKREELFSNNLINIALAEEIIQRVTRYKNLRLGFWDLLFSILISFVAFLTPDYLLKYSSRVTKDAMEDEVNQFNALISMLLYDKSMTVKQILIEMESYAIVFKRSMKTCINDYGSGDINALQQLKEEEPYPPLNRIIDNLIRCDEIPMQEAFHEINMERAGYLSKRRLANEKSIKRRANRAYLLAAVPLLLLFAYGIIPTLISSMNEITSALDMLGTVW